MAPQVKGKQGTKGAKQILEENVATLAFYRNMALGSAGAFYLIVFMFFEFTGTTIVMSTISVLILLAGYRFMAFMSNMKISDTGTIIDSGVDLNMEGGIAEHIKDLIILTSGTMLLTLLSDYFWFLLFLAPIRALWMLWNSRQNFLQPQEEPEIDEKKQKKLERRMKRVR